MESLYLVILFGIYIIGIVLIWQWLCLDLRRNQTPVKQWWFLLLCGTNVFFLVWYLVYYKKPSSNEDVSSSSLQAKSTSLKLGLICLFVSSALFVSNNGFSSNSVDRSTIAIKSHSYNKSNEWNNSFSFLNGELKAVLRPNEDYNMLVFTSEVDKGSIDFKLHDETEGTTYSFSSSTPSDTCKVLFREDHKYTITATAQKAKGAFNFKLMN